MQVKGGAVDARGFADLLDGDVGEVLLFQQGQKASSIRAAVAKYLLSDLFNDNHLRLKLAAAPQHDGGEDQDHPVHRPARDGVHDLAVTLPIFGKTGDHGRLQTQDRHHGRNEVQHLGGEKDGVAQPAKLHQIDNGYGHGIKGIEGRQIEDAPRVGKPEFVRAMRTVVPVMGRFSRKSSRAVVR